MSTRTVPAGLPVGPFLAAAGVLSIVAVALCLPAGHGALVPVRMDAAPIVSARALRFDEHADGTLDVFDASNGTLIQHLPVDRNGFLHALVHGLGATRRRAHVPVAQSYSLTLFDDGRLVLADTATRTSIDMEGFGPTNMRGVLALLPARGDHA
ncbi:photosynthetic complex assembly protein PuhC [Acetobacteraceae bacterium KSS8]|uniref:Photosynthetic complex assembly protein PuhC n=1 Tax=Endosaccharibacter trunci TaxID=2812733 RepID=A0ABT1W3P2_9PROT|nr:photosynthetic complex assembly protein PuhC [Acetobacteraceae bacterium KSS8]